MMIRTSRASTEERDEESGEVRLVIKSNDDDYIEDDSNIDDDDCDIGDDKCDDKVDDSDDGVVPYIFRWRPGLWMRKAFKGHLRWLVRFSGKDLQCSTFSELFPDLSDQSQVGLLLSSLPIIVPLVHIVCPRPR